jgi:hypothetical protein
MFTRSFSDRNRDENNSLESPRPANAANRNGAPARSRTWDEIPDSPRAVDQLTVVDWSTWPWCAIVAGRRGRV